MSQSIRRYLSSIVNNMRDPEVLCECKVPLLGEWDKFRCSSKCYRCRGWVADDMIANGIVTEIEWAPGFEWRGKKK